MKKLLASIIMACIFGCIVFTSCSSNDNKTPVTTATGDFTAKESETELKSETGTIKVKKTVISYVYVTETTTSKENTTRAKINKSTKKTNKTKKTVVTNKITKTKKNNQNKTTTTQNNTTTTDDEDLWSPRY